jgi:hypothetical protein
MVLSRDMHHPDPQYLANNVRKAKCTCLEYEKTDLRPQDCTIGAGGGTGKSD